MLVICLLYLSLSGLIQTFVSVIISVETLAHVPLRGRKLQEGGVGHHFLVALAIKTLFVRNGRVCIPKRTSPSLAFGAHCREAPRTAFVAPCFS